jgi:hypothetical protein
MLTPPKYWRVACGIDAESLPPPKEFKLPETLAAQSSPPKAGHGIAIAAYDEQQQIGLFRWLGVVTGGVGASRTVEWKPSNAQIWVDTGFGRSKWKAGAFGFADSKIAGYGLHELWYDAFDGLELRDHAAITTKPIGQRVSRNRSISPERLNPIEVIGEPTTGPNAGVVYVLKSAYGYKVGKSKSMPGRMRYFGVKLPFAYTIPICAWFEDCHVAERGYHDIFATKRINGEWFDLTDHDIDIIRMRG